MTITKRNCLYAINIFIPLVFGLFIYLTKAERSYVSDLFSYFQIVFRPINYPDIIKSYACDFLWAYSLLFVLFIVIGIYKKNLKLSIIISVLFAVMIESIQLFQTNMFTFDVIDIVVEIIAIALASLTIIIFERKVII